VDSRAAHVINALSSLIVLASILRTATVALLQRFRKPEHGTAAATGRTA